MALLFLTLGLIIFSTTADAGGPWNNQYCDVELTKIRVVDEDGNVVKNLTEEKVVCKDGASACRAFGITNIDNPQPVTTDTVFPSRFLCFHCSRLPATVDMSQIYSTANCMATVGLCSR